MKKLILFLKNIFIQTESENDFMLSLNNYLETHTNELWKDASEIAVITGVTESEVIKNIDLFEGLAENSKGQFTTKNFM